MLDPRGLMPLVSKGVLLQGNKIYLNLLMQEKESYIQTLSIAGEATPSL